MSDSPLPFQPDPAPNERGVRPEFLRTGGIRVLIRGAGEMASAVAHRLIRAHFRVLMTEAPMPMAVRRGVSFSEAVYTGGKEVEGVTARRIPDLHEVETVWAEGEIPLLVDPDMTCLGRYRPHVIVDALLAKRNTGLHRHMAPLTIGLGPGFSAPDEVHLVIETHRGHDLGRLIYRGRARANTGIPGEIAGYTHQRVLRAPARGRFETSCTLGMRVQAGQPIGQVNGHPVRAQINGILRGLLRPGTFVKAHAKLGDIDPRGNPGYVYTISDKARAIGGSVLEGVLAAFAS